MEGRSRAAAGTDGLGGVSLLAGGTWIAARNNVGFTRTVTAIRWLVAASIASAMTSVGCADRPPAFDTRMEMRLVDRLERDNFLRDRSIRVEVVDGHVSLSGEVWTPLEKERAAELLRTVPGVIDVANELDINPPR